MKKITLLLVLIAITGVAGATVYLDETFDYPDGALGTVGAGSSWLSGGTFGTWSSDFMVQPSTLTYSNDGGTYILSGQGKIMSSNYVSPYGSNNYVVYKSFSPSSVATGTVYVSFLYTPGGESQSQSQAPAMSMSAPGTNAGVQVWVGKGIVNTSHFRFGTTRGSTSSADIKWSTTEYSDLNAVYLLVLKYDLSTQTAFIFVNPEIGAEVEPAPVVSDNTSTSSVRSSVQTIQFKVSGNNKEVYKVGGVRVSSTWAEAVASQSMSAVPLATPVIGAASAIGAESFTANWTAVANATGYAVKVYQGVTLHGTYDTDGQSTESLFIKGLVTNTAYTYKVIAKGDAIDYSNSEESAASLLFTTLEGLTSIETDFSDETWGTLYTSQNQPALGAFPSSYHNGFEMENTFLYDTSKYDSRGERKDYGLRTDRMSNGGMVVLPTVKSLEQIEIHAIPGGAPRSVTLKELVDGVWTTIGTYEMTSSVDYKEFIIPLSRAVPTKLRIENAGSGQVTLYQIITRTTNPTLLDAPVVGVASAVNSNHFTANWTALANATGYKVRVYQGMTIVKTVDVSGQATESVQVTELTPETEYTFKVLAVGDAFVNYADSYLSATSTSFTTGIATGLESHSELKLTVSGNTIKASEPGMFEIYNVQGIKLYQVKNTAKTKVEIPSGLYILRFTGVDGKQTTTKITMN